MERRRLGRTEHHSSLAVLGAAAFWTSSPEAVAAAIELALARGVNHVDIAPTYGHAEQMAGPLVAQARDRLFVAAKTMESDRASVRRQFDDTRRRLGCDVLDLYQAHAVISLAELEDRAEALDEIVRLRDAGLTRFVGVTGHDHETVVAQLEALRRWDLDTVMFPVNPLLWANRAYRDAAEQLLAECATRDVGVQAIKAGARRPWPRGERWATTWYEPHEDVSLLAEGLAFALSVPGVHVVCTPGDTEVLRLALDAVEGFAPLTADERDVLVGRASAGELASAEIFPRRHD
jgi:predicted aldo/keto reductase-like oxidoreductase